jgi:hypothetical protein
MGATNFSGPLFVSGDLDQIEASPGGAVLLPNPNPDRGPSAIFNGYGLPDPRFTFLKDTVEGYTGRVPAFLAAPLVEQVNAIPILHAPANIAAAANTVSGTAMTLVTTPASGITLNIPIIPFNGLLNSGAPITTAIALDWGFDFGTVTSGSTTIVVLDSTKYIIGMPLVIAGAGAASGNVPLLTNVLSITDATHIVVANTPLAAVNPAPIGTGNIWGPSEVGYPAPNAAAPYLAMGPGLFLDARQALARGLVVTASSASGVGGNIVVSGYDVFGQAMTDTIAIVPGTALAAYGTKAFKYITSAVPNFTDPTYTYSIGTSDVFGFNMLENFCENTTIWWGGALNVATTGFTAGVAGAATSLTGDVRGTIQTSAIGGGSGIGANASSGAISALALTGRRLVINGAISAYQQLNARLSQPQFMAGSAQA